jgi:23S rRNA pseudouridine2605 synthase
MKKAHPFEKFATRIMNSAIKEEFRQEKRKIKKERAERIELQKQARRAAGAQGQATGSQSEGRAATVRPAIVKKVNEQMPLNKYIAHCGVCSRRDAVDFIKDGKVKVNDVVVLEPGYKLTDNDEVKLSGKKLFPARNLVYILLNKPKDYITTSEDTHGRKTVLDLVKGATNERIYPIGRLDRNTTGVLLLTNDGELTQKLSHPSFEVRKTYEVRLDKPLTKAHFDKIVTGITLEDGPVKIDALAYADSADRSIVGIELHSGRNRIVRRIFESLGYDVKNLDRVVFGNLTKKNVERGKWRFLKEKEIRLLKFMNSSFTRKSKVED